MNTAVQLKAETVTALLVHGLACQKSARYREAEKAYQTILQTYPNHADALQQFGLLALQLGNYPVAENLCRRAVAAAKDQSLAHYNLGMVLAARYRFSEAHQAFQRSIELDPNNAAAWNNLGNVQKYLGKFREALHNYHRAITLDSQNAGLYSNYLVCSHFDETLQHDELFAHHCEYGNRFAAGFYPILKKYVNNPDLERPIRVGYLSPRFSTMIVGYFLRALFFELDSSRYPIYCYSATSETDKLTDELKSRALVWRDITHSSDDEAASQIEQDGIDILIDLAGHAPENRLLIFARKPAPIQITWLDYFNTSGLTTMDYIVSDLFTTPLDSPQRFTEEIIRLPHSRFCYSPLENAPPVARLPCLNKEYFTFGSFNRLDKITPEVIRLWAKVLQQVPKARMVIKNSAMVVPDVCEHLLRRFTDQGISAERVELRKASAHLDMLGEYADIDLALDTFPYNGGATTFDALWMGVPVVSLRGERMIARQTSSLLENVNLREFIADSPGQYVAIAVDWANRTSQLAEIRAGLRTKMQNSPLCDAKTFARHFESALRMVWQKWCTNQ